MKMMGIYKKKGGFIVDPYGRSNQIFPQSTFCGAAVAPLLKKAPSLPPTAAGAGADVAAAGSGVASTGSGIGRVRNPPCLIRSRSMTSAAALRVSSAGNNCHANKTKTKTKTNEVSPNSSKKIRRDDIYKN